MALEENPYAKYRVIEQPAPQEPEENPYAKYRKVEPPALKRSYKAGEVPGAARQNFIPSAQNFGAGMIEMIEHPIKTIGQLRDIAGGTALHALTPNARRALAERFDPGFIEQMVTAARAVGGMYAERYGSWDSIKRTMAEDPVGATADISTILQPTTGMLRAGVTGASMAARAGRAALSVPDIMTSPMRIAEAPFQLAGRGAGFVYNAFDPKGSTYRRAAGDNPQAVVNALRDPAREIVPGSMPTAAEAASPAGATHFAAMGKAASEALPDAYYQRRLDQDAARLTQVRQVGQTPADLQRAEGARAAASLRNYGASNPVIIPLDAAFQRLAHRPAIRDAIQQVSVNARNARTRIIDPNGNLTGEGAHLIKLALDDAITPNPLTANARNANNAVRTARSDYLRWLEARNPAYATARQTHAQMSVPINQMQVGQYLEGRLIPALGEETAALRATNYASALNDAPGTIRRATDQPRFQQLDQILTPQQMQQVQSVYDDLARVRVTEQQANAARGSGPNPGRAGTDATGGVRFPNLLNTITAAGNKLLQITEGRINHRMAIEIATEMLDPQLAATVLERSMQRQARGERLAAPVRATGRAASRIIHTPAVYNVFSERGEQERRNALAERRGPK